MNRRCKRRAQFRLGPGLDASIWNSVGISESDKHKENLDKECELHEIRQGAA